jgi:hypothetical protein
MIKVTVTEDSWYPVYTLDKSSSVLDDTIEIPEAIYSRYLKIMKDFEDMQDEIRQFQTEQNDYQYEKYSASTKAQMPRYRD